MDKLEKKTGVFDGKADLVLLNSRTDGKSKEKYIGQASLNNDVFGNLFSNDCT